MIFEFVPITEKDLTQYKADMQEAFQKGFEADFGESEMQILPEQDIDNSLKSKGIGKMMWDFVERLHPETKVWETCTPYFEKRNLHFYVNKCGFHVVAFWHKGNPDPHKPEDYTGDDFEGMFAFQKVMQR